MFKPDVHNPDKNPALKKEYQQKGFYYVRFIKYFMDI